MGALDFLSGGSKRYRRCHLNEDGSVDCIAYKPTKDGKKIVTASIKATITPECSISTIDHDGSQEDIESLEEYLRTHAKAKCKQPSEL